MPNLPTDGNAVAGMLADVFIPEMTTAVTTCANCGRTAPIGELDSTRRHPESFSGAESVVRLNSEW